MHIPAQAADHGTRLKRAGAAATIALLLGAISAIIVLAVEASSHPGSARFWSITAASIVCVSAALLGLAIWILRRAELSRQHFREFAASQREILERIASGASLGELLERLVRLVEQQAPGMTCSVLILDRETMRLLDGAAPNLPDSIRQAINGVRIGAAVGSCGAAAFRAERVVVEDIATDPLWAPYKELALPLGLRACWSSPIFSPAREVLGTFAMYYAETRGPSAQEIAWVDAATHLAAIAICRDAAGQALQKSEARYRQIVDTAYEGVWLLDAEAHTTFANQRMAGMLGVTAEEMLGRSMFDFMDDAARVEAEKNFARRMTGVSEQHEFRFTRKDGANVWTLIAASPLADSDGRATGALGMVTDITTRKAAEAGLRRSEAEFRAIFENAGIGMALLDAEGRLLNCNPALEQFLGYTREELCRMTFAEFTHPEDLETDVHLFRLVAAGERDSYQIEKRYFHKDGRVLWGRLTVSVVREADGALRFVLGMVEDITQRKEAEDGRARLEAQLRQSQKMQSLGTLAGGIAHDFNNILNAISGNIQLATSDLPSAHPAMVSLAEVEQATGRAADLVRRILTFSRPQQPRRRAVRLNGVVEEALRLLRASLPASIEIRTELPAEELAVEADPTQIHQVITNLGANAAHAMSEHGGVFRVSLEPVAVDAALANTAPDLRAGHYARLTISDSGTGMDAATLERMFEPFFTTKAPGTGTGLGLSVVHGIVEGHGGTITAQSRPGEGTTFQIFLPLAPDAAGETPAPPSTIERGRGEQILYLDDEERLVFLATRMIEWLGYRVAGFTDVARALEAFRSRPVDFHLVMTDLTMPGMSGREFAAEILRLRPEVPIVLTTGYLSAGDDEAIRRAGVREILLKPVNIEDLGRTLHRLIRHSPPAAGGSPLPVSRDGTAGPT